MLPLHSLHVLGLSCLLAYVSAQTPPFVIIKGFSDPNCQNQVFDEVLEPAAGPAPGCVEADGLPTFDAAILVQQEGVSSVSICERGFSCAEASSNIINNVGLCSSDGGGSAQFDKIQFCF